MRRHCAMSAKVNNRRGWRFSILAQAALLATGHAAAIEIDTGNPDYKLRWDNTVRYSAMYRLNDRSPGLSVGSINTNQNDGNNNFNKGVVSNRFDLLTEVDLTARDWGARISGAAWYDSVYNRSTDNTSTSANHLPASEFAPETRKVMGQKVELLDAFVFGKFDVADMPGTVRLGRHTLLWGESLFFGANGIAGGQAPVDLVKLLSVPNSQFKETARPTGKLSAQVQLSSNVAVGAYIGYEWDKTRLIPSGAYLSASDAIGPGGERIIAGPLGSFLRQPDVEPGDSGQGGVQLRWRNDSLDTDFGLYAIRFHALAPSGIVSTLTAPPPAGGHASSYRWYHHEGIRAFGASFAKTVGEWSLAGEASYRQNAPLASSGQSAIQSLGVGTSFDNKNNTPYAVGDTAHMQFSWLASLGPSFISNEASFLGEIAWNRRVKVKKNPQMLNPNSDRDATAIRAVFSPTYRQVVPGIDLTPSVGLGYTWGRSSALGPAFGVNKGGDLNVGLAAVYLGTWFANLNFVRYFGPEGPTSDTANNAQYKQALKDRNFVTLSLRTTF